MKDPVTIVFERERAKVLLECVEYALGDVTQGEEDVDLAETIRAALETPVGTWDPVHGDGQTFWQCKCRGPLMFALHTLSEDYCVLCKATRPPKE